MNQSFLSRAWGPMFLLVFSGLSSIILFQNCDMGGVPATQDRLALLAADQDFVYDTVVDQIAYMSCSEVNSPAGRDPSAYFTFRVGAYGDDAGISLTDEFFELTEKSSAKERLDLLNIGPGSKAMNLQLALRGNQNLQTIFVTTSGSDGTEGIDYSTMFTTLGEDYPSAYLLDYYAQGKRLKYLRDDFGKGIRIEGSLSFASSSETEDQARNYSSNNSGVLALTYRDTATGGVAAISPEDLGQEGERQKSVFGRGFELNYRVPVGANSGFPPRILFGVTERSLENASDASKRKNWTCNSSMVFKIVDKDDAIDGTNVTCNMVPDNLAGNQALLSKVRNILKPEDWWVDLTNNCIIAKTAQTGGCYNKRNDKTVEYNLNQPCSIDVEGPNPLCSHFVSICER